jgi:hypothetical protein
MHYCYDNDFWQAGVAAAAPPMVVEAIYLPSVMITKGGIYLVVNHVPANTYVHLLEANPGSQQLLQVVQNHADALLRIRDGRFTRSQDVEKLLLADLVDLGYWHEVTNRQMPHLFMPESDFEIDFYHPEQQIALEIEKGKRFNVWRDVCKFVESPLVHHAVIILPYEKISPDGKRDNVFISTLDSLANVRRMYRKLKSFFLIGY